MLRIGRPKQFKSLLHALCASLKSRPNGVSINIPVAVCAQLGATDT